MLYSEIAAVPEARLATERAVLRPLPSLRPPIAPVATQRSLAIWLVDAQRLGHLRERLEAAERR